MKDISCEIIKDLMPLYIDDICSGQSKRLVEEHVKNCENCKKALESSKSVFSSTLPNKLSLDKKAIRNPFRKIKRKQRMIVVAAVVITIILMVVLWLVIENVGTLNERIFENSSYTFSIDQNSDDWIEIGEFRSTALLFKHEITNHANSIGGCHIRIKQEDAIVLDDYYIENGNSFSAELKRGEEYIIEIKADEGQYFININ